MRVPVLVPVLVALAALAGCGSSAGEIGPSGVDGLVVPTPDPDPADFTDRVDNRWFPLEPGSRRVYDATRRGRAVRLVVTVPGERQTVAGVATTVVERVERRAGRVVERSRSWFAQDRAGNVWCFGVGGSWQAGVDGAEAGLVMAASPRVGDGYVTAGGPGVAAEEVRVVSLETVADVPAGDFEETVEVEVTRADGTVRRVLYAPGVGEVRTEETAGGDDVAELASYDAG